MQITASKIRYQGTRTEQQDSVSVLHLNSPKEQKAFCVGILADGIGGLEHGAQASAVVVDYVGKEIAHECNNGHITSLNLDSRVDQIIKAGNEALRQYCQNAKIKACGTTLIVAVIVDYFCFYKSIGDSNIHIADQSGSLVRLNKLHTTVQDGRNVLTSAIMGEEIHQIDSGCIDLRNHKISRILLSSDGLNRLPLSDLQSVLAMTNGNKLRSIIDRVIELKNRTQDNTSMILFEVESD